MEKEKLQRSIKVKIIALAISLFVCFALVGVSVWAALTQTVTINNNITVTQDGQTKVKVTVSEFANEAVTAVSTAPDLTSVSWTPMNGSAGVTSGVKDADTNEATYTPTAMDFSQTDGVNYYAYKIEFSNETVSGGSDAAAYAHITSSAYDNTQISIWYGTTATPENTLTNNKAMDTDVTITAGGTATFYVVVAANEDLEDLAEKAQAAFNLSITIDQTA